jgi:hypothetical protein
MILILVDDAPVEDMPKHMEMVVVERGARERH